MTLYRCTPCRLEWDSVQPSRGCPRCGASMHQVPASADGVPYGVGGVVPRERRRQCLVSAAELDRNSTASVRTQWAYPSLTLTVSAKVTLKGPPGSGKSTAATAIALVLARRVPVLYISAEEGVGESALQRLRRVRTMLGVPIPEGLTVSDAQDVHEATQDIRAYETTLGHRPGVIVIDSLTQIHPEPSFWQDLVASPHGIVLVLHTTTGGEARGGLEPEYAVDVNVTVDGHGRALITKNRWGPTGEDFAFDARNPPPILFSEVSDDTPSSPGGSILPFTKGLR